MNIINKNATDKEDKFKISHTKIIWIPEGINKTETGKIIIKEIVVTMPVKTALEKNLKE